MCRKFQDKEADQCIESARCIQGRLVKPEPTGPRGGLIFPRLLCFIVRQIRESRVVSIIVRFRHSLLDRDTEVARKPESLWVRRKKFLQRS